MADEREGLTDGLEHLQTAAKELIRAGRSLLDAMEGLVDDPRAVQEVLGTIGGLAQAAATRFGLDGQPVPGDEEDEGKVQRIKLS